MGFFVSFAVPAGAPRVDPPTASGGAVTVDLEGLEHGSGCVLFVRDGVISTLEGYAYGEPASNEDGGAQVQKMNILGLCAVTEAENVQNLNLARALPPRRRSRPRYSANCLYFPRK